MNHHNMGNSHSVADINFVQMSHPELMMCVTDRTMHEQFNINYTNEM